MVVAEASQRGFVALEGCTTPQDIKIEREISRYQDIEFERCLMQSGNSEMAPNHVATSGAIEYPPHPSNQAKYNTPNRYRS